MGRAVAVTDSAFKISPRGSSRGAPIMMTALIFVALSLISSVALAAPLHFEQPVTWLMTSSADVLGSPMVGDVNGDGKADLVIYGKDNGTVWVALSDGLRFGQPRVWARDLAWGALNMIVELGDVNGDGKADVITFVHGTANPPETAYVYVALSTGTSFIDDNRVWNDGFCIAEQTCKVADINGDGKADLIAFTPNFGLVWVSLSTGNGFAPNAIRHNFFCLRFEFCEVGDVEGDGRSDLILFKPYATGIEKGNVLMASSLAGGGFQAVRYGHGFFCIDGEWCRVGDVNGDKRADILLIKGFGSTPPSLEVLVSLSNGTQFINAAPFSWARFIPSGDGIGLAALADVTGDGRADLVLTEGHGSITHYKVLVTTDRDVSPTPITPPPPPREGVSAVDAYNCTSDQLRVFFWVFDWTTGGLFADGPVDAMYSKDGFCPDPNDKAISFELKTGHVHEIRVVAPDAIGCEGRNDPDVVACVKHSRSFLGNAQGKTFSWIVEP